MAQSDRPPAGWVALGGVIEPGESVAAYAARRQTVRATCRSDGCNRNITIDPVEQAKRGFGAVSMRRLRGLWTCHRLDGCTLGFFEDKPEIPLCLYAFVGRAHVRVRLRCQAAGCKFYRVWTVEEIVAGLEKRGVGGERTEVDGLGKLMTTACAVCKRVNWAADVLWVDTDTMGWKALGERCFEAAEIDRRGSPAKPISAS